MRAVVGLCSKRQGGTFEALALATGHAVSKELAGAVYALFEGLEVNSFIKNKLPGVHELLALSNEMYTTSRSDNFVIPLSHEMLLDIVRPSYVELG